jgi:hypothetical protein
MSILCRYYNIYHDTYSKKLASLLLLLYSLLVCYQLLLILKLALIEKNFGDGW